MRARLERDDLRRALKTVLPAIGKTQLTVLNGVHIEAGKKGLRFTASDLQLTITAEVDGDVIEPGGMVPPARLLAAFVDRAPAGAVALELDDHEVTVTAGDATATLKALPADEWPRVHPAEGDPVTLSAEHVDLIRRILPFASKDEGRPVLTGLYVTGDRVAATDSYRLAEAHLAGADLPPALIPAPAVVAALKGAEGDVALTVGERSVTFAHGRALWTTVLIEGDYPPYDRLIRRKSPHGLTFNSERLMEALGRAAVVGGPLDKNGNRPPVRIRREGDKATVGQRAIDSGSVEDVVACDGDFEEELGLNPEFLTDMIAAAGTEDFTIGLVDSLKPVECLVDGLVLMLMPTRLKI